MLAKKMKTSTQSPLQMKALQYLSIIVLLCSPLRAEEKKYDKLLDYEGVTVRKVEKGGIRIMHKSGFATIPIEDLPEEVREELGMSMEGVTEHREEIAAARAEAADKARIMAAKKKILKNAYMHIEYASVFQVVNGGILARVSNTWDGTFKEVPIYRTESNRVGNALSGYRNVRRKIFTGNKKVKNTYYRHDWLIFVRCDNSGLRDGSRFSGDVWDAGTYSYTTAIGGGKTIPRYTTNPEDITKP